MTAAVSPEPASRSVRVRAGAAIAALVATVVGATTATASPHSGVRATRADTGVPAGAAEAAFGVEPTLPRPAHWPFPDAFPRTSGTGRLVDGALEWSDFLVDDHGATGLTTSAQMANGALWKGTYSYADPAAHGEGADIFRLGVGARNKLTYWRVDWATLTDPSIPAIEFGLIDPHLSQAVAWPGGAGVTSRGLRAAIVISSRGAWRIDSASGRSSSLRSLGGWSYVDRSARSFVAAVPSSALPPATRVAAVSGVADANGTGFAPVSPAQGAEPGQPAVYNIGFRSYRQEPTADNAWMEKAQAAALSSGDISAFSAPVNWPALAHGSTSPEPHPTGYVNRWYVSSIKPGNGIVTGGTSSSDGTSNLADRVVPYAAFVPTAALRSRPLPLTLLLHALGYLHNQYELSPKFLLHLCEQRHSLCVMPSGRSPSTPWYDNAELDAWEVWRDAAMSFRLDPTRSVVAGYSMGGLGATWLGLSFPAAFSEVLTIAGGLDCGIYATHGVGVYGANASCQNNGNFTTILPSARWLPFLLGSNAEDELSPAVNGYQRTSELSTLGYRWQWQIWLAQEHLAPLALDSFASIADAVTRAPVTPDPGHVTYTWYSATQRTGNGLVPHQVYWLSQLTARTSSPGSTATVDATTGAYPSPPATLVQSSPTVVTPAGEVAKVVSAATWRPSGAAPETSNTLALTLTNTSRLSVSTDDAGLSFGRPLRVQVRTDGASDISLLSAPASIGRVGSSGHCARVRLSGTSLILHILGGSCTVTLTPATA